MTASPRESSMEEPNHHTETRTAMVATQTVFLGCGGRRGRPGRALVAGDATKRWRPGQMRWQPGLARPAAGGARSQPSVTQRGGSVHGVDFSGSGKGSPATARQDLAGEILAAAARSESGSGCERTEERDEEKKRWAHV
nr:unnamed protein product [Digitaria exilis]